MSSQNSTLATLSRPQATRCEEGKRRMLHLLQLSSLMLLALVTAEYPLHEAAFDNDLDKLTTLSATLTATNLQPALNELGECASSHSMTPLACASAVGATEAIDLLLKLGAAIDLAPDDGSMAPLHWTSARGHTASASALLAANASVDVKDSTGMTPLHYATARGHTDILTALLAAGADVEAMSVQGATSLQIAAEMGQPEAIAVLVKAGANLEAAADEGQMRPLHAAAMSGDMKALECVKLLLTAGAIPDSQDAQLRTPLQLADEAGDYEVLDVLREALLVGIDKEEL